MAKANPAVVMLAQRMVEFLEAQRAAKPTDYMLPLQDVIDETRDQADDKTVEAARKCKEFKDRVIVADPKDARSPVALQEDLTRFAESPQLLGYLKSRAPATGGQPYLLANLAKKISAAGKGKELKAAFTSAMEAKIAAGDVKDVTLKKVDPAEVLAGRMLARLQALREFDPSEYMLPLRQLAEQADETVGADAIKKAIKRKEFKGAVFVLKAGDESSPVAFHEDLDKLAASDQLLTYLKQKVGSDKGPPPYLPDLVKAIPGKTAEANFLRQSFESATRQKIAAGAAFGVVIGPLSPEEMAEKLVMVLKSQRDLGNQSYPLTLERLADLADVRLSDESPVVFQAVETTQFKNHAVAAWAKGLDAPVALLEDIDVLAAQSQLLEHALRSSRDQGRKKHSHTAAVLAKKIYAGHDERLRDEFIAVILNQCEHDALPPFAGAVLDGQPRFFLLEDLLPESLRRRVLASGAECPASEPREAASRPHGSPAPRPSATAGSEQSTTIAATATVTAPSFDEFARRFEETFSRLDRQRGGYNFVSLAEMRHALGGFERSEFDAYLHQLRKEQRFTLSESQSKQGVSREEREAGIVDKGYLLTYVSRRK